MIYDLVQAFLLTSPRQVGSAKIEEKEGILGSWKSKVKTKTEAGDGVQGADLMCFLIDYNLLLRFTIIL